MKKNRSSLAVRRQREVNKAAAVFLAPVVLVLVVYIFYPIVNTFQISTLDWNGISADAKFIGLDNWIELSMNKCFLDRVSEQYQGHASFNSDPDSAGTCNGYVCRIRGKEINDLQDPLVYSAADVLCGCRLSVYLCSGYKRRYYQQYFTAAGRRAY